jgi:hypothetical protein
VLLAGLIAGSLATAQGAGTPANGTLSVRAKYVRSDTVYIEGAYQYLVVKRSGEQVYRERFDKRARLRLAVGRYWVGSYARPCDGNCSNLDAPRDRCSRHVVVRGGETARATVRITVGRPCSIRLTRA